MYPSHLLGESVSSEPGLQLGRGLITPLEVALLKAPVDTDGHVVRDTSGEADNLLNADISESGGDDIGWETEESLGNLAGTWVLVVKSGDESERLTAGVDLVMDGTLGENGSLALSQGVGDETSSVLLDEPDFHVAINEVKELGRPGMGMGGVHSARRHLTDSHGHAIREERREVGDIGEGEVSAGTPNGTNSGIVVEQPVFVVLEDIKTGYLGRCPLQIGHELGGLGSVRGLSDSLKSGSEDERDSSEELHGD